MSLLATSTAFSKFISIDDLRRELNVLHDLDDHEIDSIIKSSTEYVEVYLRKSISLRTWELRQMGFCDVIELPKPPLISVDKIEYIDPDGLLTELVDLTVYDVDILTTPGQIRLGYEKVWPEVRAVPDNVIISFTSGYANSGLVPAKVRRAIIGMAKHLYDHGSAITELRLAENPKFFKALLFNERVHRF